MPFEHNSPPPTETFQSATPAEALPVLEPSPRGRLYGRYVVLEAIGVGRTEAMASQSILRKAISTVRNEIALLDEFNDPNALYARCLSCGN